VVNWLSSSDKDCRYLREDPTRPGAFVAFAKELGVELPKGVKVVDAVRWGWIEPSLRVRLPDSFFLDWENYPERPRVGSLRTTDAWAEELHDGAIIFSPRIQLHRNDDVDRWFVHPFDRLNCPDTEIIRAHEISSDAAGEPEIVLHSNGSQIVPYIDFFAYWQVYRLAESIAAATMFKPIFNTPAASERVRELADDLPRWQEFSNDRLAKIAREYRQRQKTFDWLSRYRTLMGSAVETDPSSHDESAAAAAIVHELGLSADVLKAEIRDVLLVLFQEWKWDLRRARVSKSVVDHLRQDIKLAVDFVVEGTGVAAPLDDAVWTSDSGFEHLWARMHEALPYELERAQTRFPFLASMYLNELEALVTVCAGETQIEQMIEVWWRASYPVRRFALLFLRLHKTLGGDHRQRITFEEENTIDYLILCTLVAEKLMAWLWIREHPQPAEVPAFKPLLLASLARIAQSLAVNLPLDTFNALYRATTLYDLTETRELKLFRSVPEVENTQSGLLLRIGLNFAVMRNYAAHHDCLDAELTYSESGNEALTAITTLVVLLLLTAGPQVGA
jgi:hypothetical protein